MIFVGLLVLQIFLFQLSFVAARSLPSLAARCHSCQLKALNSLLLAQSNERKLKNRLKRCDFDDLLDNSKLNFPIK